MKTYTRKTEQLTETTGRDPVDVALGWTMIVCAALFLMCLSVLSPLIYIWTLGVVGIVSTLGSTILVGGAMLDSTPLGFLFVGDVFKGGLEVAFLILRGLLSVS